MLIVKTLQEIAHLTGGEIKGNYTGELTGVSSLKEAMTTDVAFLGNEKYEPQVLPSKAGVVLVPKDYATEPPEGRAWIACENPSHEFTKVVAIFRTSQIQMRRLVEDLIQIVSMVVGYLLTSQVWLLKEEW